MFQEEMMRFFFCLFVCLEFYAQDSMTIRVDSLNDCVIWEGTMPNETTANTYFLDGGTYVMTAISGGVNYWGYGEGSCGWYFRTTATTLHNGAFYQLSGDPSNSGCFSNTWQSSDEAFASVQGKSMEFVVPEGGDFVHFGVLDSHCSDNRGIMYIQLEPACAVVPGTNECNLPPIAMDKTKHTTKDTPRQFNMAVLDYDPNDNLYYGSVRILEHPINGLIEELGYGLVVYTPDPGFVGEDSIVYEISDWMGLSATGTVTVVVEP